MAGLGAGDLPSKTQVLLVIQQSSPSLPESSPSQVVEATRMIQGAPISTQPGEGGVVPPLGTHVLSGPLLGPWVLFLGIGVSSCALLS